MHRAGLPLDLDAFPRQLVEFLSINLQRGIHRRHLLLLPDKRGDAVPHLFFRHGHWRFCCHGSAHVLRIRCDSKVKQRFIRLRFIGQHIAETRSLFQGRPEARPSHPGLGFRCGRFFFWCRMPRSFATTSCDVNPASFHTFRTPFIMLFCLPLFHKKIRAWIYFLRPAVSCLCFFLCRLFFLFCKKLFFDIQSQIVDYIIRRT